MKILTTVGRIIFALPFLVFGAFHLMAARDMAALVPDLFPGPGALWVVITGLVFLAVALSLLSGRYMIEASLVLAFQLLIFILTVWAPQLGDADMGQLAMVNLLKDIALFGAALTYAGLAHHHRHTKKGSETPIDKPEAA